jgi:vacuolar iron transporter family protein
VHRGLDRALAKQVAEQLMAHDALAAHARDELGFSARTLAHPLQAALASAASFTAGAALPLLVAALSSNAAIIPLTIAASLVSLFILGAVSAAAAGAQLILAALRVTVWSALAMGVTAAVGALVGAATNG